MTNKRKLFLILFILVFSVLQVQAQLTYLNGNIGINNPNPITKLDLFNTTSGDMFRCGMGAGYPLFRITQYSSTGGAGKRTSLLFENGAFELYDAGNNISRLWMDAATGNVNIGNGAQVSPTNAKVTINTNSVAGMYSLNLFSIDNALVTTTTHSMDWGYAQTSNVNRATTKSWAVNYSGTTYFSVSGDGWISARGATWSSDARYKKQVQNISNHNRIFELQAKSYKFDANAMKKDHQTSDSELALLKTEYGFLAQDVQKIFPELVSADENGYLSVNYVSIVPMLVEVAKEQKDQIAQLEQKIQRLDSTINHSMLQKNSPKQDDQSDVIQSSLDTRFNMYISPASKNASLNFYNLNGTQLKSYTITSKGQTEFLLKNNELPAGIYIHNLIVDGVEVFSKRIVLSNGVTSSIK